MLYWPSFRGASKTRSLTPPRRSFHSRRPRERASLVSTPPGQGEDSANLLQHQRFTLNHPNETIPRVKAGGLSPSWLHWGREAASRVRSHISPGPYRSFRELSLAGSVDPVTWCPPTFVGNSGIERSNGHRGFALFLLDCRRVFMPQVVPAPSSSYSAKAEYPVR